MKNETDIRAARAEMEDAKARAERKPADPSMPRRYKLYDKIKDRVSLRTIDTIIVVTALLIVGLLIYGIATANPPQ